MNRNTIYDNLRHGDITAIVNRASEIRGKQIFRDAWYRFLDPETRSRMSVGIVSALERAAKEVVSEPATA